MEKKKYDASVQLLRIIGCLTVIGCHVRFDPDTPDGGYSRLMLFFHSFLDDGVTIFFVMTGFFMFRGKKYKEVFKSTFIRIVLPSICLIFVTQYLRCWVNGVPYGSYDIDWKNVKDSIMMGELGFATGCGHLHYVARYIKIVLLYPLLKLLCKKENTKACIYVVALSVANCIMWEMHEFVDNTVFSLYTLPVEVSMVILGYVLYANRELFIRKGMLIICPVVLVLINIIRTFLQYKLHFISGETRFYNWSTSLSFAYASVIAIWVFNIKIQNEKIQKCINYLGKMTFSIYLIHMLVFTKLDSLGVKTRILDVVGYNTYQKIIAIAIYMVIVFVISLVISIIISEIIKVLKRLVFCKKKREI